LELVGHQDGGHIVDGASVAVVRKNGIDTMVFDKVSRPHTFLVDVGHKGWDLACDFEKIAAFGVSDVEARLGMK
jgi:hypothetical protein